MLAVNVPRRQHLPPLPFSPSQSRHCCLLLFPCQDSDAFAFVCIAGESIAVNSNSAVGIPIFSHLSLFLLSRSRLFCCFFSLFSVAFPCSAYTPPVDRAIRTTASPRSSLSLSLSPLPSLLSSPLPPLSSLLSLLSLFSPLSLPSLLSPLSPFLPCGRQREMQLCAKWREAIGAEAAEQIKERREKLESLPLKEQEERGYCLRRLRVVGRRRGLHGRHVISLSSTRTTVTGDQGSLPATRISVGDVVSVGTAKDGTEGFISGVVSRLTATQVQVAFEDEHVRDDQPWDIQGLILRQLSDTVTFSKLNWTITQLERAAEAPSRLYRLLMEQSVPPLELASEEPLYPFNKHLNESQLEAISFALRRNDVAVIHGPPGTGKTTTVVELILQLIKSGKKVLVAAASNMAVDNLMERLLAYKANAVRIGHPARLLESVKDHSLDSIINTSEEMGIVRGIYEEMAEIRREKDTKKNWTARKDIKDLRKDAQDRESRLLLRVLGAADVVCGTTTTIHATGVLKYLPKDHFDVAVVDEAGQALEVACWAAIMQAPRCVLAGDHLQLPPTIISAAAALGGLAKTLLERVVELYGDTVTRMLEIQYRMHGTIQGWSSAHLYNAKLSPADSVARHVLVDLEHVTETEDTTTPLILVDTAGSNCFENTGTDDISKCNEGEARIVVEHVKNLLCTGLHPDEIGVITPYNLQVETIRNLLATAGKQSVEVSSVDGFQGREKEAIVISFVRSNGDRSVGFLRDYRRINVAVTRARRHLCIVCDSSTVSADEHIHSLLDYLNEHGLVRTVYDYSDASSLLSVATSKPSSSKTKSHKAAKEKQDRDKANQEERNILRRRDLEKQINDFEKSGQERFDFPATLTSYERMLVHDICSTRLLQHESVGEGAERHVVLRKPQPTAEPEIAELKTQPQTAKPGANEKSTLLEKQAGMKQMPPVQETETAEEKDEQMRQRQGEAMSKVEETKPKQQERPASPQTDVETDIQRMLRERKERLQREREELLERQKEQAALKKQAPPGKGKKPTSALTGKPVSVASAVASSAQRRQRKKEDDIDALVAAIENPNAMPSDIDKKLPKSHQVQRNPFIDATMYVRAGVIEQVPVKHKTKSDVKRDQLKKKLQNTLDDKSTARKSNSKSKSKK
eukprot:m.242460 g.242460  ORF g.242460 m.242460 type:complete len:1144 (+) comp17135_c12_seq4:1197-4628(+)